MEWLHLVLDGYEHQLATGVHEYGIRHRCRNLFLLTHRSSGCEGAGLGRDSRFGIESSMDFEAKHIENNLLDCVLRLGVKCHLLFGGERF